jgi:hypothetical protein
MPGPHFDLVSHQATAAPLKAQPSHITQVTGFFPNGRIGHPLPVTPIFRSCIPIPNPKLAPSEHGAPRARQGVAMAPPTANQTDGGRRPHGRAP